MEVTKSINWRTTSSQKHLLTLELPAPDNSKPPTLKVWPYTLSLEEVEELLWALTSARQYMAVFNLPPPVEGVPQ
jgi:hypothetical protein